MNEPQTQALVPVNPEPMAVARQTPTPADMLSAIIEKGITQENVGALEKLADLYERMEARNAERSFAASFVELQKRIPQIKATKVVPNNDGTPRYSFAPFEEIDYQARPICLECGFTYSFMEGEYAPDRVTEVCILQHNDGHKREHRYTVRIGSGPPKATPTQADGSAHSYAKRMALCDALNIVVQGIDADPRLDGDKITAEQAKDLQRRVHETGSDEGAFLKFAGVTKYDDVPAAKYGMLDAALQRKESTR